MILKPVGSRIIVRKKKASEEKTVSGIIVSTETTVRYDGEIIAVGPHSEYDVGDRIIYGTFAGTEREIGLASYKGYKDCFLMNDADILCTIVEEEDNVQ